MKSRRFLGLFGFLLLSGQILHGSNLIFGPSFLFQGWTRWIKVIVSIKGHLFTDFSGVSATFVRSKYSPACVNLNSGLTELNCNFQQNYCILYLLVNDMQYPDETRSYWCWTSLTCLYIKIASQILLFKVILSLAYSKRFNILCSL